jgi:hypothetical protein
VQQLEIFHTPTVSGPPLVAARRTASDSAGDRGPPSAPRDMVHAGGLATEREAAAKVLRHCSRLHELVLQAFRDRGSMNDRELERLPQFVDLAPSTARKRRSELFQAGRLIADGKRDGLTLWRVAPTSPKTGEPT